MGDINVRDHGAVGDGITDDSRAIQLALEAASKADRVVIPDGNWHVEDMLHIPDGVVLLLLGALVSDTQIMAGKTKEAVTEAVPAARSSREEPDQVLPKPSIKRIDEPKKKG